MKRCQTCKQEKPKDCFGRNKTSKDGLESRCKECRKNIQANMYKDNWFRETAKLKKSWCLKHNIPFDLDAEYLESIWTACCPVFGVEFEKFNKKSDKSPALDRINPLLGYVKGNVCYISARANRIKYDASVEELLLVVKYLEGATTIPKGSTTKRLEAPSP